MKCLYVCICILSVATIPYISQGQADSVHRHKNAPGTAPLIKKYKAYLGKPVYTFLLDDSIRHYVRFHIVTEPPGVLGWGEISYSSGNEIRIFCQHLHYLSRYNDHLDWSDSLFYKETISELFFLKNNGESYYFGVY